MHNNNLMNHIVVLLFTGIHNIAVHNLRQGQGVHKYFTRVKAIFIKALHIRT
jgi:hypothetical protein